MARERREREKCIAKIAVFCKENLSNSPKRCRISSALKYAFCNCHPCNRRHLPFSSQDSDDETPTSDFDEMQEVVVSVIRSRAMTAKFRRSSMMTEHLSSVVHPISGELFIRATDQQEKNKEDEEETEDFASVHTHFSHCSSAVADSEAFYSVKTNFSCCLSLKDVDIPDNYRLWTSEILDKSELRRRAIIQEFCHCEGWPFGLCRKALLLPPLPKSPSDSWTWCKGTTKMIKTY